MINIKKLAIGIMSGTSLDGIDVVLSYVSGYDENTKLTYIDGLTIPWSKNTYNNLLLGLNLKTSNIELISKLNYQIPYEYYEATKQILNKNNYDFKDIDFISMHGQTMWHDPYNKDFPSTLQLGSGSVLSTLAKTTVISNFRVKDLILKGQGAPLVPYFDKLIFDSKNKYISLHNLGGISNLTLLHNGKIILAYDTGPANMMIDFFIKKLFNKSYDNLGEIAQKGKMIKPLYDEVMNLEFFKLNSPKSTGRELFGDQYSKYLYDKYKGFRNEDYVHTVTMITIDSIVNEYQKIIKKYNLEEIIFSGGGAHNKFILESVQNKLNNIKVSTTEKYNISIDFKEALAFIVLGNQTFELKTTNLKDATGSDGSVIIGEISYYK